MSWSFDLPNIPRDRTIIAETAKGDVLVTRFNQPTKGTPRGWFSMIGDESRIVAWQEMPAPSGRTNRSDGGLNIVHRHSEISIPIIEDVGGE